MTATLPGAEQVFTRFEVRIQSPYLAPDYVWADARRRDELQPEVFIFEWNDEFYYHPLHVAAIPGTNLYDAQSAYSYGGPVASTDDSAFLRAAWSEYLRWCRDRRIVVEFIRFHPLLENWQWYGGEVVDNRQTIWLDLTRSDLPDTYRRRRRQQLWHAIGSGLHIRWVGGGDFLDAFLPMYEDMLRKRTAADYYAFPGEYYDALLQLPAACTAICQRGDEIMAAAIFLIGGMSLEYHLAACTDRGRELGAMTYLIHAAAEMGRERGCQTFHLGGGTDGRPDNALLFFKAGFSELRGRFRTGRYVHDREVYEGLKEQSGAPAEAVRERVLFYRS